VLVAAPAGTQQVCNCNPNCAPGKYTGYGTGLEAYSAIVIEAPSLPNGTFTYTKDTAP
jgi:hypothetical protein